MDTVDQETMPLKPEDQEMDPLEMARLKGAETATESLIEEFAQIDDRMRLLAKAQQRGLPLPPEMTLENLAEQLADLVKRNREALDKHTLGFAFQNGDPNRPVLNTHYKASETIDPDLNKAA